MSSRTLQELVELPMTGLRFGLADKLLRIRSHTGGASPFDAKHIERIIKVLEENEIRAGQILHLKGLVETLQETLASLKNPGEIIWEILVLFRMIGSEEGLDEAVKVSLDRVMMDWQGHIFPRVEFEMFLKSLEYICEDGILNEELANAGEAVREGLAPEEPNLKTPEKQLLWAAHLLYLIFNPELMEFWPAHRRGKGPLHTTQLWRQVLSSKTVRYLRALYGSHIFNLLRQNDLMVGWGAPGTWFSFSLQPPPGKINCDLLYSMLAGFDHSRACVVHEISHAVLTKGIPFYIRDLSDAIQSIEGQDQAYALSQELQLKQYFLNAAEDNCINRFTEQIGKVFGQDYGYSLNNFYTSIGDVGRRFLKQREVYPDSSPENQFKNLTFIISRVFLANNGLFDNSAEAWASLMARPDWIKGRDRDNPEEFLDAEASFEQLLEMCEEVEHYYPPLQELSGGPDYYGEQAEAYAERRFELILEMWDLYAADIVKDILEDEETEAEDAMDDFEVSTNYKPPPPNQEKKEEEDKDDSEEEEEDKPKNPSPPSEADQSADDVSDDELEGEPPTESPPDDSGGGEDDADDTGEGGEGEDDIPEDGEESEDTGEEGSSAPQQDGKGEQEDNEPPQDKEESDSEGEEDDSQGEEQDAPEGEEQDGPDDQAPEDQAFEEQEEQGESEEQQEGDEEEGGEEDGMDGPSLEELMEQLSDQLEQLDEDVEIKKQFDEAEEAEQKLEEDPENAEAELIREEVDPNLEPEMKEPSLDEKEEQKGEQGADHGGVENNEVLDSDYLPDEPLASISELMEALKEADEAEAEQAKEKEKREEKREEKESHERFKPPTLEVPETMSLDELAQGSWDDFSKRVTLHGAVIGVMAKALEKLKNAQLKFIHKVSRRHSLIPQGGDLRRFDQLAMSKLIQRLAKREKFDKDHLNMFRKDGRIAAATRPTRIILIDGSRSMSMGAHPLPMNKAIQEAVIDYMASRIAGYDTFITMFGPQNPVILAQPGDSLVEIGKRIELVHGGLNTMTYLSPSLLETIRMVAYRKKFEEPYVGFTNFVIYSDGDIDDMAPSRAIIHQIMQHAPKTTFDFVLITTKRATPMDILINTLDVKNPLHEIGIVRGRSSRRYPMALTATYKLTNRLIHTPSGIADPSFLRNGQFKRLFQLLTQQTDI